MQSKNSQRIDTIIKRSPLFIAGIYFIFSSIWIIYSDSWVLGFYDEPEAITRIQTIKGWFFVTLSSIVIYLLILTSNQTILKYFKNKLRIENIYEATFEQAAVGIVHHDEEYNWMRFNEKFSDMLQYSKSELMKMSIDELVYPDDLDYGKELDQKVLNGELNSYQIEKRYRRKDESIMHVLLSKTIARDTDNQYMFFVSVLKDITYLKEIENKLESFNIQLEQQVEERTKQLEAINEELESFSYSVSHDLRSPLRAISGYSNLLLEDHKDQLNSEGKEFLDIIHSEVGRMGNLIDDLLAFSKLSRTGMQIVEFDMDDLVQKTIEEVVRANSKRAAHFDVEKLHHVNGDPNLLKQVWINLMSNAVKYQRKGVQAEIIIRSIEDVENQQIIYSIKDNGVGFDMKYTDKLFGVFQRLHSDSEFEGTGIGLALVKRIVNRHNGEVWAESEPGSGSVFYFSIPK
mgnify:CR=1 FL=1|tara:strand:- start:18527 stop:19903 length:1377 start_codon:yes stop_codon:yes gene_type:complete